MGTLFPHLLQLLEEASEGLPAVMVKRMFGCDCLFASGKIYAMVWKSGRLGVRLPDAELFARALALDGSEPWRPGTMTMSHWVLLSESFHDDPEGLREWVRRAHAAALTSPRGGAKKPAGPAQKPAAVAARPKAKAKAPPKKSPSRPSVARPAKKKAAARTGSRSPRRS